MRPTVTAHVLRCCLFAVCASSSSVVLADNTDPEVSPALDRISLWLGAYDARSSTTVSAGLNNVNVKGRINLQDDLGFPSRKVEPRVRFDFLLGESQGLVRLLPSRPIPHPHLGYRYRLQRQHFRCFRIGDRTHQF